MPDHAAAPPSRLDIAEALDQLLPAQRDFAQTLNLALLADDGMYEGSSEHYLLCGASALNVVQSALLLARAPAPASILDFGAGAGRVTRWLRAAFPSAAIGACELRPQDVEFCRAQFAAEAWVSGTDIDALEAPRRYDLIWVGSVLTHLSAEKVRRLIAKLMGWTNPGGLLVMSMIGRTAKTKQERRGPYIHQAGWEIIRRQYVETGFGYADYQGHDGYGLSLTRLSWTAGLVETMPGARLVLLAEQAWDGLHDVLALQNMPDMQAETTPSGPLRRQLGRLKRRATRALKS